MSAFPGAYVTDAYPGLLSPLLKVSWGETRTGDEWDCRFLQCAIFLQSHPYADATVGCMYTAPKVSSLELNFQGLPDAQLRLYKCHAVIWTANNKVSDSHGLFTENLRPHRAVSCCDRF